MMSLKHFKQYAGCIRRVLFYKMQNVDGQVWTLKMLKEHIGVEVYEKIMEEVKKR